MGLATAMSLARWVERASWPYLVALQAAPILALTPLISGLLGFGFNSRVLVVVLIAFFPIVNNTLFGLLSVDQSQHELFTLQGASRATRLWKLQYPAAMPSIFVGLRNAAGLAVIGAVVGDFFFRQGDPGIGALIDVYRQRLYGPEMFTAIILSALLGLVVFIFFGWLGNRAVGNWHTHHPLRPSSPPAPRPTTHHKGEYHHMKRRAPGSTVPVASLLLVAACGSDNNSSSDTTSAAGSDHDRRRRRPPRPRAARPRRGGSDHGGRRR